MSQKQNGKTAEQRAEIAAMRKTKRKEKKLAKQSVKEEFKRFMSANMSKQPSGVTGANAAGVIANSHAPQKSKQPERKTPILNRVLKAAGNMAESFLKNYGIETLLTLGTALLGSSFVRQQPGVTDTIVPAGTVLAYVDLYPNFAQQSGASTETRLYRVASTFMRWKFTGNSCINFVPSAGALANGQIGMFITSDPRYEVTATGQDAVRLVHEFNGAVAQISQGMCLPVPPKKDWLYVEDAHESDIRFTRQGTLWVIAFTDIDISTVGSSLGEMRLDYEIQLKDNSVDGVVIQDDQNPPTLVLSSDNTDVTASTTVPTSTGNEWFIGGADACFASRWYGPSVSPIMDTMDGAITYNAGDSGTRPGFFCSVPGIYEVSVTGNCTFTLTGGTSPTISVIPIFHYYNGNTEQYHEYFSQMAIPAAVSGSFILSKSFNWTCTGVNQKLVFGITFSSSTTGTPTGTNVVFSCAQIRIVQIQQLGVSTISAVRSYETKFSTPKSREREKDQQVPQDEFITVETERPVPQFWTGDQTRERRVSFASLNNNKKA